MGKINYLKILWIVLYLLLAALSCFVTEESIHLSFPTYSVPMCWIITISFYLIASLGGSLLLDSFSRKPVISFIDVKHHRTACMIIGTLILVVFWLVFSMPTNTHTFLYRNQIDKTVSQDITTTKNYLNQLKVAKVSEEMIARKQAIMEQNAKGTIENLCAEIINKGNPGDGPTADSIRRSLAGILNIPNFDKLSYTGGRSKIELEGLCELYRQKAQNLIELRKDQIRQELLGLDRMRPIYTKEAESRIDNIQAWENAWQLEKVDVTDAGNIRDLQKRLSDGYATIKNYQEFVVFPNDEGIEKTRYTSQVLTTRIERLISVLDTWWDFLTGRFGANLAMVFCIFVAVLVDLAAFVFFYLALKK